MILQPSAPPTSSLSASFIQSPPSPNLSSNSFLEKKGSEGREEDEERGL